MTLEEYQLKNCEGCYFAEEKKVGTGKPCCTKPTPIDSDGIICKSKQPTGTKQRGD